MLRYVVQRRPPRCGRKLLRRTALYAVDSLPLKWRTEVYRRYPDLQERAESKEFVDTIEPDAKALDYFQTYKLADGRNLPEDKVLE